MLVGGVDVSGDRHQGQHNHVALVVGAEDAINRVYNKIGISPIHMSELSEHQRLRVRNNLDLSSNEISVWCFHISRRRIEDDMLTRMRSKNSRMPRINVHKSFETYWFRLFRSDLESFTARFRTNLAEVMIQADADMNPTLKCWGMASTYKGRAYELADAVAWFNQKGAKIRDCRTVDLREKIRNDLERGLAK